MNNIERFKNVMAFREFDRLPIIEWAPYWDKTLASWYSQGLPDKLKDDMTIRKHFGLDSYRQVYISNRSDCCPEPKNHGTGIISNTDDFFE